MIWRWQILWIGGVAIPRTSALRRLYFLRESITSGKICGVLLGLSGVVIVIWFGGKTFGITLGDVYLIFAMLTLSVSLLFIRRLTFSMSSYQEAILTTFIGTLFMTPAVIVEAIPRTCANKPELIRLGNPNSGRNSSARFGRILVK